MPVSITHIMGTVALFMMLIAVGFAFSVVSSQIEADLLRQQLGDVAGYVSANINEMIWLVDISNSPGVSMTKIIELPENLAGKAYNITLVQDTKTTRWYVQASMVTTPSIVAQSVILFNVTESRIDLHATPRIALPRVLASPSVYGGNFTYVVWGQRWADETGNWIYVGLGRLQPEAG